MKRAEAIAFRKQIETVFELATPTMSKEEKLQARGLCKAWKAGMHKVGEVYVTLDGQMWECIQGYDNSMHPGVVPGAVAWGTFHKPYHGTTPETAMPWVAPTGAHDIYKKGEYMIWADGALKRCIQDTNFSPAEYDRAWEDG
jgi:hypothetical protein